MTYRSRSNRRIAFIAAIALASTAGSALLLPNQARADDCLLDTNNDGDADATTDTDGGANSSGEDSRLACGVSATASGQYGTAIGNYATASATDSTALGWASQATGINSTALGELANASGPHSTAVGAESIASNTGATAFGVACRDAGTRSKFLHPDCG